MAAHLCITVRLTDPTFHGRSDGGTPEWPPSPLRLFQALVAAAAARFGRPDLFRNHAAPAFEWLAGLHPPSILTPPGVTGSPLRTAVPNNDLDTLAHEWARGREPKKQPAELKTLKTVWPPHIIGGDGLPALHYLWEVPDSDSAGWERHKELIRAAAGDLVALGWGIDMAFAEGRILSADDIPKLKGQRWEPATDADATKLRVPIPGTFDALVARHTAFCNRLGKKGFIPVPPLSAFRLVGYRQSTDPLTRRYAAFRLRHPVEDHSAVFSMIRANCVAAMTRHTMGRLAQEQGRQAEWIDHYVHGHRHKNDESLPRFSYLPLPSIERRGERGSALGAIRRVLVAELFDSGESHLQWARQMLPGQFLTDDKTEARRALLVPLTGGDWVLRRYVDPADTWATVTPLVLPGSDEGKFAKAEKLFFKALHHAGYSPDALAELDFRNVSFWPGGELALSFHRPNYLKNGCWSVYHVRLRWKQAIKGPVAIGAGRHCGLGVFASFKE